MTRTIFTALLASATLVAAAPTFAQDLETRTVHVSFADLDLSSKAGETAFKVRLASAVAAICGEADIMDLPAAHAVNTCKTQARAQAAAGFQTAIAQTSGARQIVLASR